MPEEDIHELASDRPIEHLGQDKFGRHLFARQLADGITRRKGRHSSVVSLQGAWGGGKTSVKNLVLAELKGDQEQGKASPHIVEFEPWQLRDADSLFSAFFKEISIAIGGDTQGDDHKKERLLRYSKALTLGGTAAKWIGVAVNLAGVPGATAFGQAMNERAKDLNEVFQQGAEATTDEPQQSLKQLKDELKKLMEDLERPVLVVIDDIDRLEVEEMLLIFQLVKANADFPNFTYLLLMQRDAVQKALVDRLGEHGRDYLDKIIQLPIDVPPANAAQRYKLFSENLKALLVSWQLTLSQEAKSDFELLWQNGLSAMLQQPRDVVRLLNALEFSLGVMKGEGGLEVNLADFAALETLRLAEPATYARLPMVKAFLTAPRRSTLNELLTKTNFGQPKKDDPKYDKQVGQDEMDAALKDLSVQRGQSAREVLTFVFPQAYWALGTEEEAQDLAIDRRIETSLRATRYFDRYFALSIPEDQISQADLREVVASADDIESLNTQLNQFNQRKLLSTLLSELIGVVKDVPSEHQASFLTTLLNFCELNRHLPILRFVFAESLALVPDRTQRGEVLRSIFENSPTFGIPAQWIKWQEKPSQRNWATLAQLTQLRDTITPRIVASARTAAFWDSPAPLHSLGFWSSTQPDEVKKWINEQVATDEQLLPFLVHFRSLYQSADGSVAPDETEFEPKIFDWLEDVGDIKARVEALDTSAWNELDRITAQKFVRYAHGWIQRKTQDSQGKTTADESKSPNAATSIEEATED